MKHYNHHGLQNGKTHGIHRCLGYCVRKTQRPKETSIMLPWKMRIGVPSLSVRGNIPIKFAINFPCNQQHP